MDEFDKGDKVRVKGEFYLEGTLTDPAAVIFKYKNPSGTVTTLTYGVDGDLVKETAGIYHVDVSADTNGHWACRWESTGAAAAADESEFYVRRSQFS